MPWSYKVPSRHFIRLKEVERKESGLTTGLRPAVPGGVRVPWHLQISLSQPGGADCVHQNNTGTPGISDLPTALGLI